MDYFQFNPDLENHIVAQLSQTYIGFDKYNRNTHVFDFSNKHDKAKYLATRHRLASIFNINALFDMQGKKIHVANLQENFTPKETLAWFEKTYCTSNAQKRDHYLLFLYPTSHSELPYMPSIMTIYQQVCDLFKSPGIQCQFLACQRTEYQQHQHAFKLTVNQLNTLISADWSQLVRHLPDHESICDTAAVKMGLNIIDAQPIYQH